MFSKFKEIFRQTDNSTLMTEAECDEIRRLIELVEKKILSMRDSPDEGTLKEIIALMGEIDK